jgi:hypothetical protein
MASATACLVEGFVAVDEAVAAQPEEDDDKREGDQNEQENRLWSTALGSSSTVACQPDAHQVSVTSPPAA